MFQGMNDSRNFEAVPPDVPAAAEEQKEFALRLGGKGAQLVLGAIIGLGFLALALRNVEWARMFQVLREARYLYLLPAAFLLMGTFPLRAWRWRYILEPVKRLSVYKLFAMVLVGYFANFVLPLNAGELVRPFILSRREGISTSSVLATVVLERVVDLVSWLVLLGLVFAFAPLPGWLMYLAGLGAAGLLGGMVALWLVWQGRERKGIVARIFARLPSSLANPVLGIVGSFSRGLQISVQSRGLGAVLGITPAVWLLLAAAFNSIGRAVGIGASYPAYILLVVVISLGAAVLPALPMRVGTLEFLIISTFAIFGVEESQALAFVILLRAVRLVPLALGYVYFQREGLHLMHWKAPQEAAG